MEIEIYHLVHNLRLHPAESLHLLAGDRIPAVSMNLTTFRHLIFACTAKIMFFNSQGINRDFIFHNLKIKTLILHPYFPNIPWSHNTTKQFVFCAMFAEIFMQSKILSIKLIFSRVFTYKFYQNEVVLELKQDRSKNELC